MEGIHIAQMLADLSDINASESRASKVLVEANKHIFSEPNSPITAPDQHPATATTPSQDGLLAPPKRPVEMIRSESHEGRLGRTASPHSYNLHHRRMLTSPPLSRCASATPSGAGTPRRDLEDDEVDKDDKVATIMRLYEIRAKLRQHPDNDALNKARDNINDLAEKQRLQQHSQQRQHNIKSPTLGADHRPPARD